MNFSRNAALWIIVILLLFALFNLFQGSAMRGAQEELQKIFSLFDPRGLREVPRLGYCRRAKGQNLLQFCRFLPQNALTSTRFTVA